MFCCWEFKQNKNPDLSFQAEENSNFNFSQKFQTFFLEKTVNREEEEGRKK